MLINLDFFKTFLNFLKATPRDWEEKNKESLGYIKNKPFYITEEKTKSEFVDIIPEDTYEFEEYSIYGCNPDIQYKLEIGQTYFVIWDGVEYEFVAYDDDGYTTIGATWSDLENGTATIPFQISSYDDNELYYVTMATSDTSSSHTIRMCHSATIVTPSEFRMKSKYLPHFQANWNEEDDTKVGYIQNKPFYLDAQKTVIFPKFEYDFSNPPFYFIGRVDIKVGNTYIVNFDDVEYECVAFEDENYITLGGTDEHKFIIVRLDEDNCVWQVEEEGTHTIEISELKDAVVVNDQYVSAFQSNWNENDETKSDYINNRPFYLTEEKIKKRFDKILPETTLEFSEYTNIVDGSVNFELILGETYTVLWNGTVYEDLVCHELNGLPAIGSSDFEYSDCPILIASGEFEGNYMAYFGTSDTSTTSHTIGIAGTIIERIPAKVKVDSKYLPHLQPDWNENDETSVSYIKNKPFYYNNSVVTFIPETTLEIDDGYESMSYFKQIEVGETYIVTLNGETYECVCWYSDGNEAYMLGNGDIYGGTNVETGEIGGNGEPFSIDLYDNGACYLNVSESGTYTVKVESIVDDLKTIDTKFLPEHLQFGNMQEQEYVEVLNEEFVYSSEYYFIEHENFFEEEMSYKVDINGNVYDVICYNDNGYLTVTDTATFYIFYVTEENSVVFNFNPTVYSVNSTINASIQKLETVEYIKKIDEKYLPKMTTNVTDENIVLKDTINGYEYIIEMQNGQLISFCKINTIEITSMPTNTTYFGGGTFDPTGLVITATRQDGTVQEITNFTYNDQINEGDSVVVIIYKEGGIEYKLEIPVITTVAMLLSDFEYTEETDGTYTLTGWKGTLNGEPSTEIIIPDNEMINA